MDDYQAFQLDVALAIKYSLIEKDEQLDMLEAILHSIENLTRAWGAKIEQKEPRQRMIKVAEPEETEPPLLDDVLKNLTGGATILNINESELPEWQGR